MKLRDRVIEYPKPEDTDYLTLYKYVTPTALTSFLTNGCLKISFGYETNDPFELIGDIDTPGQAERTKIGFISFTALQNDPFMWGCYAEKYRGALMTFQFPYCKKTGNEFDRNTAHFLGCSAPTEDGKQREYRRRWTPSADDFYVLKDGGDVIFRCNYTEKRPVQCLIKQGSSPTAEEMNEWSYRTITSKHTSWAKEDEYRIIYNKIVATKIIACGESLLYLTDDCTPYLTKITLGPMCPITPVDVYQTLAKNPVLDAKQSISFNRATFEKKSYLLNLNTPTHQFPQQ